MSRFVKPYGDTMNDGKVQLSFTLPVEWSEAADEAARQLVAKMGFTDVQVVEGRRIAPGFSFFVVYASTPQAVDVDSGQGTVGARRTRCRWKRSTRSLPSASAARFASPARASVPTRTPSASTRSST